MIISLRLTLLITLKVFRKVPIIGFRRAKSLKDILVRVKVLTVKKNEGFYGPCKKQESFKGHFAKSNHNSVDDWEVKLIDQAYNTEELRKGESLW